MLDHGEYTDDTEIVISIREELYNGCVDTARELIHSIYDQDTQREMRDLVREYEQSY